MLLDRHEPVDLFALVPPLDLEFEPGETFSTLGGGDLAGLTYGAIGNHLVLKPKAPAVSTSLTVITNRRTYVIDYTVLPGRPDPMNDELVYSLRFNYPPNLTSKAAETVTEPVLRSTGELTVVVPALPNWPFAL